MSFRDTLRRAARFSVCRDYRYTLERYWNPALPICVFLLLNPSKATHLIDDPTNVRGMTFANAWGCGTCIFTNLYAWRTPKPAEMKKAADPVGPLNDQYILHWARRADILVAAWGTHGTHLARNVAVLNLLKEHGLDDKLQCLDITKGGHPKHPLYIKGNTKLRAYA